MKKFVLDNPQPFIVPIANWSGELAQSAHEPLRTVTSWPRGGSFAMASPVILPATHQGADRVNNPGDPLPTVTAANRGELMMASPVIVGAGGPVYAGKPVAADQPMGTLMTQSHRALASAHLVKFRFNSEGAAITDPVPTITSGGNYKRPAGAAHAMGVCTAFIEQANGGFNTTPAKGADEPLTTVTNTGSQQHLVTASLATLRRNCVGRPVDGLVLTMTAGAEHHALVEYKLSPEHEEGALPVAAFLISYYGTENISACDAPAPTVTTKDRLGLVTVFVKGTPYVIVDICLRMLQPHELYRAQGFPASYIIDKGADGKPFTKTEQVHMCGNSVSPPPMAALARAAPIDAITPAMIAQYRDSRSAKTRANREIALLSHVFNTAREWGLTTRDNPCLGVRKNKEKPRDFYANETVWQAVYEEAPPELKDAMDLAYLTGQRPSDVLSMRKDDVEGIYLMVSQGKTGKRLRIVLEVDGVKNSLGQLLERIMRRTSEHLSPFFILNEHGKRMSWPMLRNRWADAREAARVKAEVEKKPDLANRIAQFQFRDIRPKAASEINDLSDASVLLGHSKEGITERVYRRVGAIAKPSK